MLKSNFGFINWCVSFYLAYLYNRTSGGPVDTGPEYQQDLEKELFKLKQMYGKADMNTFPDFKFEDPKFEVLDKPQPWRNNVKFIWQFVLD